MPGEPFILYVCYMSKLHSHRLKNFNLGWFSITFVSYFQFTNNHWLGDIEEFENQPKMKKKNSTWIYFWPVT